MNISELKLSIYFMIFFIAFNPAFAAGGDYIDCITDPRRMNFQEMNNINYHQGTIFEVKNIYKRLSSNEDFIGLRSGSAVYFMFDARPGNISSSPIISYECEELYCQKKDFYKALNICTKKIGSLCQPLAATSGQKNFCFLLPEEKSPDKVFLPFNQEDK